MATPAPADPGTLAGNLASTAGTQLLDMLSDVLPVVVPFLLAMWAVRFVWGKVAPRSTSGDFSSSSRAFSGFRNAGFDAQERAERKEVIREIRQELRSGDADDPEYRAFLHGELRRHRAALRADRDGSAPTSKGSDGIWAQHRRNRWM